MSAASSLSTVRDWSLGVLLALSSIWTADIVMSRTTEHGLESIRNYVYIVSAGLTSCGPGYRRTSTSRLFGKPNFRMGSSSGASNANAVACVKFP